MMGRIITLLLVFSLLLMPIPVSAANSGSCGENAKYTRSGSTLKITGKGELHDFGLKSGYMGPWIGFRGDIKKVVIGEGITGIGKANFANFKSLTSVTLPETLTKIGDEAFYGCTALTEVAVPDAVTSIGDYAFYQSGLTDLTLGESLREIGECAFTATKLTEVTIPVGVSTVSRNLFNGCDELTGVVFQGHIQNIGEEAFYFCKQLKNVEFQAGLSGRIEARAFSYCTALEAFDFPVGVTEINESAFDQCEKLSSVTFPEGLEYLGGSAFRKTAVKEVYIPESVTRIGYDPFVSCDELEHITLHTAAAEGIRQFIGSGDKIAWIHVIGDAPETTKKIFGSQNEDFILYYDAGTSGWELPTWNGYVIEVWGEEDQSKTGSCGENLTWTLRDGVLTISGTGPMDDYSIGEGFTAPWYAYAHRITGIVIEEGVTSVGEYAFRDLRSVQSVHIAESVEVLGNFCFENCDTLPQVTIPAGVTQIGWNSFWYCYGLKQVDFKGDAPNIDDFAFVYVWATCTYPGDNPTWTEEKFRNYGGNLTWISANPHIHALEKVEAKAATHWEEGNIEYHTCPCGEWYADAEGTRKLDDPAAVVIPIQKVTYGDANHDGKINVSDAVAVMKHRAGALSEKGTFCEHCANVDTNPRINVSDAVLIMKKRANKDLIFPIEAQ